MIIKGTETDKRNLIVTEIDKSVFVEAGAGAGKTTLIIQRVENLLKSGVEPENIVVITFTNKATEELVSRLNDRIMKLSQKSDLTDEEKKNLENARRKISRMQVSTIHGFCSRLLRENALGIGLPIEQNIVDEAVARYEQKILFEESFKDQLDSGDLDPLFTLYDSVYQMKKDLYELYTLFLEKCNKDVELPNTGDPLLTARDFKTEAKQKFAKLSAAVKEEVSKRFDSGDLTNDKNYDYLLAEPRSLFIDAVLGHGLLGTLKKIMGLFPEGKLVSSRCKFKEKVIKDENGKKLGKTKLAEMAGKAVAGSSAVSAINSLFAEIEEARTVLIQRSLKDILDHYYKNRDNSTLTNDLLLEKTRDLLKGNESLTEELSKKFRHIFIDEFQDVDHFQAQMALMFYKAGSRVFIVGDPKQSIYRFRGAEPKIFDAVKKMFKNDKNDLVFELDNNYRSDKSLLDWINTNYITILKKNGYRKMIEGNPKPSSFTPGNNTLQGLYVGPEVSDDGSDVCEANRVACLIRGIVDGKFMITDKKWDDASGQEIFIEREINYDDFLVLAWNTTRFPEVVDFFRAANIPCTISGNLSLALYCVLERFILIYRHLAGAGEYKLTLEGAIEGMLHTEYQDEAARKDAAYMLSVWKGETYKMNGPELAGFLMGKLRYLLPRDTDIVDPIARDELTSSLGKLHQMVETVSASGDSLDKKSYYESIRNYFSGKLSYEISFGETINGSVRVMNMDKAKGLESKIVILMYRDNFNDKENEYYIETITEDDKKKPLDIMDWKYRFYYKGILNSSHTTKEHEENSDEKNRKQYVIVTRAEEVLIVMPLAGDEDGDYLEKLSFDDVDNITDTVSVPKLATLGNVPQKNIFKKKDVVYSVPDELKLSTVVALTPSGLEHEEKIKKDKDSEDENSVQTSEVLPDQEVKEDISEKAETVEKRPSGDIFGTIMHRAFELFMCYIREKENVSDDDAIYCANIAVADGMDEIRDRYKDGAKEKAGEYRDYLKKVLAGFLHNESVRSILSTTVKYYTEYDFSFQTDINELGEDYEVLKTYLDKKNIKITSDQKICINGIVDLMLLTDDGKLHIIDYKSDTKVRRTGDKFAEMSDEDFIEHLKKYDGQLALYRIAMSKVFGISKDDISTTLYDMYNGLDR